MATTMPTREAAIEQTIEWRNIDVVDDHSLVDTATEHLDDVFDSYELPDGLTRDRVDVVGCYDGGALGSTVPYGCGLFTLGNDGEDAYWSVGERPDGYVVFIAVGVSSERSVETTVRHELAHICGWETEGVTYEQTRNHETWMDRLDGW